MIGQMRQEMLFALEQGITFGRDKKALPDSMLHSVIRLRCYISLNL